MKDSEIIALCRDALFSTSPDNPVVKRRVLIDDEKWRIAVCALNGEAIEALVPDWAWSPLQGKWVLVNDTPDIGAAHVPVITPSDNKPTGDRPPKIEPLPLPPV